MMEREGVPKTDALASRTRQAQLEIVFNRIISTYNSWRRDGYRDRGDRRKAGPTEAFKRYSPLWILAGDFNFTEESQEYAFIKRMNFIDTVHANRKVSPFGTGTKARGATKDPTLTVDYVFAGPNFVTLDPVIEAKGLGGNWVIHDHEVRASDHYPIISTLDFRPAGLEDFSGSG